MHKQSIKPAGLAALNTIEHSVSESANYQVNRVEVATPNKERNDVKQSVTNNSNCAQWPSINSFFRCAIVDGWSAYEELPAHCNFWHSEFDKLSQITPDKLMRHLFGSRRTLVLRDSGSVISAQSDRLNESHQMMETVCVGGNELTTELSTEPRREFLVIRFKGGTLNEQAASLLFLSKYLRLTVVTHNGPQRLEGWYCCRDAPGVIKAAMFQACLLGADPSTWCPAEPVSLPGARCSDGQFNQIVLFDTGAKEDCWVCGSEINGAESFYA